MYKNKYVQKIMEAKPGSDEDNRRRYKEYKEKRLKRARAAGLTGTDRQVQKKSAQVGDSPVAGTLQKKHKRP